MFEHRLDWFYLREGEYVPLPVDEDGVIRSQVFPGLWLAANDLLAGNMGRVLAVLIRRVGGTGTDRIFGAALSFKALAIRSQSTG